MTSNHPFHEGELLVQQRAGETEAGRRNGRIVAASIVPGALPFLEQQPLAVVGSLDLAGNVWASVLVGEPGFLKAPDDRTIELDLGTTTANPRDPLFSNLGGNPRVGMLVIDLGTRRRLRINGTLSSAEDRSPSEGLGRTNRWRLSVEESYPNCPKYIQRRHLVVSTSKTPSARPNWREGRTLRPEHQELIRSSDTFFVASAHPERGVDASHRGGDPGFARILDDRTLRIPDYPGNSLFNTLGNFAAYPHAGLVFLDFERSRTLQITGHPALLWDEPDPTEATGGTRRFWDLAIERWVETDSPRSLRWEFLDSSRYNPIASEK